MRAAQEGRSEPGQVVPGMQDGCRTWPPPQRGSTQDRGSPGAIRPTPVRCGPSPRPPTPRARSPAPPPGALTYGRPHGAGRRRRLAAGVGWPTACARCGGPADEHPTDDRHRGRATARRPITSMRPRWSRTPRSRHLHRWAPVRAGRPPRRRPHRTWLVIGEDSTVLPGIGPRCRPELGPGPVSPTPGRTVPGAEPADVRLRRSGRAARARRGR